MSILFGTPGAMADIIYTKDWWVPETITGTIVSLEGFIVGFMIGGIATVLYEDIFRKRIRLRNVSAQKQVTQNKHLVFLILLLSILFFGSFYIFGLNSLIATIIALGVPTLVIWITRPDLILDSLVTGVLLLVVASIVYTLLHFLTPGWIEAFWHFRNVPHIIIFNLPIDDIIWYFFAGMFIGPLYEYWKEGKLVDLK